MITRTDDAFDNEVYGEFDPLPDDETETEDEVWEVDSQDNY